MSQNSSRSVKGTYYIRVRATGWFVWYKYYEDGNAKGSSPKVGAGKVSASYSTPSRFFSKGRGRQGFC